jgi:hypothetical protein
MPGLLRMVPFNPDRIDVPHLSESDPIGIETARFVEYGIV